MIREPNRRRIGFGVLVGAVVVSVGGVAFAMTRGSEPTYRLASATTASVQQSVTTTGTVATVDQASLSFPVRGQVATVRVRLGDAVRSGQTIATLDRSSFDDELHSAQNTAAAARQTLASDEAAQSATASSGLFSDAVSSRPLTAVPSGSATPSSAPSRSSGTTGDGTSKLVAAVRNAQQKVIADQHRADLDADLEAADKAVVAEQASCRALLAQTTPPAGPSSSSTASPTTAPSVADDLTSCQTAITAVQKAQHQVQGDEDSLSADEGELNAAVSALLEGMQTSTSGGGAGTSRPTTASGSPGAARSRASSAQQPSASSRQSAGRSGSGASTTQIVTAQQLAADQKAIDAADANVTVAEQDRSSATLKAPLAGTVAAVAISSGESVSAGSTSEAITILGRGQKSVSTAIGIADVDLVKVGTPATVTVDGTSQPLTGKVSYIGSLNTAGTAGATTTYPMTVLLSGSSAELYDGAGASVALQVGTAHDVLTVPTSAVHRLGTLASVSVYSDAKVTTTRVTLGVQSTDRIQIVSGLRAGQRVVLATVSAPVPTSTAQNGRRGFGGGGLVGGGGLGGGRP